MIKKGFQKMNVVRKKKAKGAVLRSFDFKI